MLWFNFTKRLCFNKRSLVFVMHSLQIVLISICLSKFRSTYGIGRPRKHLIRHLECMKTPKDSDHSCTWCCILVFYYYNEKTSRVTFWRNAHVGYDVNINSSRPCRPLYRKNYKHSFAYQWRVVSIKNQLRVSLRVTFAIQNLGILELLFSNIVTAMQLIKKQSVFMLQNL